MKNHMSKSRTICMLLQQSSGVIFTNPFYTTLIQSVDKACQQHGYGFLLMLAHARQDVPSFFSCASAHNPIDGLIITSPKVKELLDAEFSQQTLPIVLVKYPVYKFDSEKGIGGRTILNQSIEQAGRFSLTALLEKLRSCPRKIAPETIFDQIAL